MVFTTEGFLEVAIESWPEWDLNPRLRLKKKQMWRLTKAKTEMKREH